MHKHFLIISISIIFGLCFISNVSANVTGIIYGKILDIHSNEEIVNVILKTNAGSAISDKNGNYMLIHEAGSFTLTIQHSNYLTAYKSIEINPFEYQSLDIFLTPHEIEIEFSAGLNLFSYPAQIPQDFNSYDLFEFLGGVSDVSRIQTYSGKWITTSSFLGSIVGACFPVITGKGLLVYMKNSKSIIFTGKSQESSIDLNQGFNLVGFNNLSLDLSSWDLMHQLGSNVIKIMSFSGRWESCFWFYGQTTGKNFNIEKGNAYLIFMNESVLNFNPQ
jgi:hypothetical protein